MLNSEQIKVAVFCGETLLTEGVKFTLRREELKVVDLDAEANVIVADYEPALKMLTATSFDARQKAMAKPIVVLSHRAGCSEIRHAISAGARGYLTADCGVAEVAAAIRNVHSGKRFLSAAAAAKLAEEIDFEKLTSRELEVLRLVAEGCANKTIARDLDISVGTVKSHVKAILHKLDSSSRTAAAAVAERRGMLKLPSISIDSGTYDVSRQPRPAGKEQVALRA
ncbi:LuxR C-terminal-related transcriptional regulator [Variovorax sp. HJSM1_2]|uniref:LuxR C-terminal-related transcriptional regulator n=1 Tax=Variovorax sp. HJSM1_2 TaxID=3366263 RepID=UPI003BBB0222